MSPNAGPGEKKYPDKVLDEVVIHEEAKELVRDLWNEARPERMYAIAQIYLDNAHGNAYC